MQVQYFMYVSLLRKLTSTSDTISIENEGSMF